MTTSSEALAAKVAELERRLEAQEAELRVLRARDRLTSPEARATSDRRHFVRAAAAAAAGAVAGGAALLADATPAAAADGSNLIIGSSVNTGTQATGLAVTGDQAAYGLGVTDNGLASLAGFPGVLGHAKGTNFFIG